MTNPLQSLTALYNHLTHFGQLPLYKINCSKSNLIDICLTRSSVSAGLILNAYLFRDTTDCPFKQHSLNELRSPSQEAAKPLFLPLRSTHASWAGKLALTKMFLLLHLLCVSHPPSPTASLLTRYAPVYPQQLHMGQQTP